MQTDQHNRPPRTEMTGLACLQAAGDATWAAAGLVVAGVVASIDYQWDVNQDPGTNRSTSIVASLLNLGAAGVSAAAAYYANEAYKLIDLPGEDRRLQVQAQLVRGLSGTAAFFELLGTAGHAVAAALPASWSVMPHVAAYATSCASLFCTGWAALESRSEHAAPPAQQLTTDHAPLGPAPLSGAAGSQPPIGVAPPATVIQVGTGTAASHGLGMV